MKWCIYKPINQKHTGIILEEFLNFRNVNWCDWGKQWTYTNTYFKIIKININTFYLFLSVKCAYQKFWFVVIFSSSHQAIGNNEYNDFHKISHLSVNIFSMTEFSVILHNEWDSIFQSYLIDMNQETTLFIVSFYTEYWL